MSRRSASTRPSFFRTDARKKTRSAPKTNNFSRRLNHETLEKRELLAADLLAIRPDAGALITENTVLNTPPREFSLLFNGNAELTESSINENTIRLVRSGGDGTFGDGNEVTVQLGYVGFVNPNDTPLEDRHKIVIRPASTAAHNATDPSIAFPDDFYQIEVIGSGANPLTGSSGAFNGGADSITPFRLDRGAEVIAVVPQPVSRQASNAIQQLSNRIDVYFDQEIDPNNAVETSFYNLVQTKGTLTASDDASSNPTSVTYNAEENRAELTFSAIPEGTYRLDIGSNQSAPVEITKLAATTDVNTSFATATEIDGATGLLGAGIYRFEGSIEPQNTLSLLLPGGLDEPGHRNQQVENHFQSLAATFAAGLVGATLPATEFAPGDRQYVTANAALPPVRYSFPLRFPLNGNNVDYENVITPVQKEITRAILEIYAEATGYEFIEAEGASDLIIGRGDLRASDPAESPSNVGGTLGLGSAIQVVIDEQDYNSNSFFGDDFSVVMFHEIGHALGLRHSYDLPSTMNGLGGQLNNDVNPGDNDLVHLQRLVPPSSTDIDLYHFKPQTTGRVQLETIAERYKVDINGAAKAPSLLNTVLRLFERNADGTSKLIASNENYFGSDSYLDVELEADKDYYVGVSSVGNDQYDPAVADSGFGGTTFGDYELKLTFVPAPGPADQMYDVDGTAIDGDADGTPGGVHSFWFDAATPANTIFVDKASTAIGASTGSQAAPFRNIDDALNAASQRPDRLVIPDLSASNFSELIGQTFVVEQGSVSHTFTFGPTGTNPIPFAVSASADDVATAMRNAINTQVGAVVATGSGAEVSITNPHKLNLEHAASLVLLPTIVRIVGNSLVKGVAGVTPSAPADVKTLLAQEPYLIGLDPNGPELEDGKDFEVPRGTTVMIDAGAILKMRAANLDVGTSAIDASRLGGALQILGTPTMPVYLRSYHDDDFGGESDGNDTFQSRSGDFGGIVIRDDSDLESRGIFLNSINHADIKNGGGKVVVSAVEDNYSPIHILNARPTVSYNTIADSVSSAVLASPDSFDDSLGRIGPDIGGNYLVGNGIDGLFVQIRTDNAGRVLDKMTVSGRFDDTDITHVLKETLIIQGNPGGPLLTTAGNLVARPSGRLQIDPGTVIKLDGARIEAERGASNLIAEGTENNPIIFTSFLDDRYGGSGDFDTSRDPGTRGTAGDWSGLFFSEGTSGSIDHAVITFGGGDSEVPFITSGVANFNPIEIHQADVRVANTLLTKNASGLQTGANDLTRTRDGRGTNSDAVIFVRGAQPVLIGNKIVDNAGAAIDIDVNSLQFQFQADPGRQTGLAERYSELDANRGPLIRYNELDDNVLNGLQIRANELTTESIWDDTDIVHVVSGEITVDNLHTYGGLRLQSSVSESLVVKMDGATSGFTATGTPLDIVDRIGGTIQVIGQPGYPVIITTLGDDSVGAGFTPAGKIVYDTNNNGAGPAGTWRGFVFDEWSNDRNVAIITEVEPALTAGNDVNNSVVNKRTQELGTLAPNMKDGDETRRLGFEVHGFISPDAPNDNDIYSFRATGGTQVWIDLDRTASALDATVQLLASDGRVIASSGPLLPGEVLSSVTVTPNSLIENRFLGGDFYSTNIKDDGMMVTLNGTGEGTYFVRVRSNAGLTSGAYQLQIRMQQIDEFPGSTVRYADIRNATRALDIQGLPSHSPLVGDAAETTADNNTISNAQALVNLLQTDSASLSIAGEIANATDVDVYSFAVTYQGLSPGANSDPSTVGVVFDLDYADRVSGVDTSIAVFDSNFQLIYIGRESNIEDDRPSATSADGRDIDDFSRGSVGEKDPYIGPVQLTPGGTYYVAVMSDQMVPTAASVQFFAGPDGLQTNDARLSRLEPVSSVARIVEDHIGFSGYDTGTNASGNTSVPILPNSGVPHPVDGRTDRIFDISSATELDYHLGTLSLGDVALYMASDQVGATNTGDKFYIVNAETGGAPITNLTPGGNSLIGTQDDIQDIVIRSDGQLYGYRRLSGNGGSVGQLVTIDPGNLGLSNQQPDNIPGTGTTPNTANLNDNAGSHASRAQEFMDSDEVDALTFERIGTNNSFPDAESSSPIYETWYSVRETATRGGQQFETSRLYNGRANGDASVRTNTTDPLYGFVGEIQLAGVTTATAQIRVANGAATPDRTDILLRSKLPGENGNFTVNINRVVGGTTRITSVVNNMHNNTPSVINIELDITGSPVTAAPTAQDIVNLINGNAGASDMVIAIIAGGNGANGDGANGTQAFTSSVSAGVTGVGTPLGRVTGLSHSDMFSPGTLYGVTEDGQFISISQANGQATILYQVSAVTGFPNESFAGLAIGPQNVEGGRFKNILFATTTNGRLYAFDPQNTIGRASVIDGVTGFNDINSPAMIFNGDTATSVQVTGTTSTKVGIAFSPLDFNLWHPTAQRRDDAGHGINTPPDDSRAPGTVSETIPGSLTGSNQSQANGGASFYFGLEDWDRTPGTNSDKYLNPTGENAQYGLSEEQHRDLSSRFASNNSWYALPGVAKGTLLSRAFSLEDADPEDRPTLYFNYYLDTEEAAGDSSPGGTAFRDSARVYVKSDQSNGWELVASNNSALNAELPGYLSHLSDPASNIVDASKTDQTRQTVQQLMDGTGVWRQARVDLSTFAGDTNIELRFDFSSSASSVFGAPLLEGDQYGSGNDPNDPSGSRTNGDEGFYIDDIIVGYAERGEMVTGSPTGVNGAAAFVDLAGSDRTRVSAARAGTLQGSYQLEIRRTDYGFLGSGDYGRITSGVQGITINAAQVFDTNMRHVLEQAAAVGVTQTGLLGDDNRVRAQGMFIVENNIISDSIVAGIHVQPGATQAGTAMPHQGPVRDFGFTSPSNLVPGVVIQNNVIVGGRAINFEGQANINPQRSVPYGRIVNNTLVGNGGGISIDVIGNARPTILNNIFTQYDTAVRTTGLSSDTEVNKNLFHGVAEPAISNDGIVVGGGAPLFDDLNFRARRNYYLASNTQALDASENDFADANSTFTSLLGISPSPVLAPNRDALGQVRAGADGAPSSAGGGSAVKDMGAIDRVDGQKPYAFLLDPIDVFAGKTGVDTDPLETIVQLSQPQVDAFSILLSDGKDSQSKFEGTNIDPDTVINPLTRRSDTVLIRQNNRLLEEGEDFTLDFNRATGELRITPITELWKSDSVYEIILFNEDHKAVTFNVANGSVVNDGDTITVGDGRGADVVLEFDSGYILQLDPADTILDGQTFEYFTATGTKGYTARFQIEKLAGTPTGNFVDEVLFDDNLNDDNLILEVADPSVFEVGDFIRINDEIMVVVDLDVNESVLTGPTTNPGETIASTIRVRRAVMGTQPGAHRSRVSVATSLDTTTLAAAFNDVHTVGTSAIETTISVTAPLALNLVPVGTTGAAIATYLTANPTYIQIEQEILRVRDVNGILVTVERGALGTPRSDHPINAPVTRVVATFANDIEVLAQGQRAATQAPILATSQTFSVYQGQDLGLDPVELAQSGSMVFIRVNDEIMRVNGFDLGTNTLTVDRGALGTTITSHEEYSVVEVIATNRAATLAANQSVIVDDVLLDGITASPLTLNGTSFLKSDHVIEIVPNPDFLPKIGDLLQIGTEITRINAINGNSLTLERGLYDTKVVEHSATITETISGVETTYATPIRLIDSAFDKIVLFESDPLDDAEVSPGNVQSGIASKIANALRSYGLAAPGTSGDLDLRLPFAQGIEGGRVYLGGHAGDMINLISGTIAGSGLAATTLGSPGTTNANAIAVPFIPSLDFPQTAINAAVVSAINNSPDLDVRASTEGGQGFYLTGEVGPGPSRVAVNAITVTSSAAGFTTTATNVGGIADLAGNTIRPNRTDLTTRFTIGLGANPQYDYGDGVDTSSALNRARHLLLNRADELSSDPRLGLLNDPAGRVVDTEDVISTTLAANVSISAGILQIPNGEGAKFTDLIGFKLTIIDPAGNEDLLLTGITPGVGSNPDTLSVVRSAAGTPKGARVHSSGATVSTHNLDNVLRDDGILPSTILAIAIDDNTGSIEISAGSAAAFNNFVNSFLMIENEEVRLMSVSIGTGTGGNDVLTVLRSAAGATGGGQSHSTGAAIVATPKTTTLVGEIDLEVTEITVTPTTGAFFADRIGGHLLLGEEIVLLKAIDGDVLTVVRGELGTVPTGHGPSTKVSVTDDENGIDLSSVHATFNVARTLATGGGPVQIIVNATDYGVIDGWIDFNGNGILDSNSERIFDGISVWPGENVLSVNFPTGVTPTGQLAMRLRISSIGGLTADGLAIGGEVEDHVITMVNGAPPMLLNLNALTTPNDQLESFTFTENVLGVPFVPPAVQPRVFGSSVDVDGDAISVLEIVDLQTGRAYPVQGGVAVIPELHDSLGRIAGHLTVAADSTVTFVPRTNYDTGAVPGTDTIPGTFDDVTPTLTFGYRIVDSTKVAGVETGTVTITVTPVNQAPTLDAINTTSDDGVDLTMLIEDQDLDNDLIVDTHTVTLTGISAGGDDVQPVMVTVTTKNLADDGTGNFVDAGSQLPLLITNLEIVGLDDAAYDGGSSGAKLRFSTTPDQYGKALISVTVSDTPGVDGILGTADDFFGPDGVAGGGDDITPIIRTLSVTVAPVNDKPDTVERVWTQVEAIEDASGANVTPAISFSFTAADLTGTSGAANPFDDKSQVVAGGSGAAPFNEANQLNTLAVHKLVFGNDAEISYDRTDNIAVTTTTIVPSQRTLDFRNLFDATGIITYSEVTVTFSGTDGVTGTMVIQHAGGAFVSAIYTPVVDVNDTYDGLPQELQYIVSDSGVSIAPKVLATDLNVQLADANPTALDNLSAPIESDPEIIRFSITPAADAPFLGDFIAGINRDETEVDANPLNDSYVLQLADLFVDPAQGFLLGSGLDATGTVDASWVTITAVAGNPTGLLPVPTINQATPSGPISLTFTPVPDAYGVAEFVVTITNPNNGLSSTPKTLTVTVNPTNDAPVTFDRVVTGNEDTVHTFTRADLLGTGITAAIQSQFVNNGTSNPLYDESEQTLEIYGFNDPRTGTEYLSATYNSGPGVDVQQSIALANGDLVLTFREGKFVSGAFTPDADYFVGTSAAAFTAGDFLQYGVFDTGVYNMNGPDGAGGTTVLGTVPVVNPLLPGGVPTFAPAFLTFFTQATNDLPTLPSYGSAPGYSDQTVTFYEDQPLLFNGTLSANIFAPGTRIQPGPSNEQLTQTVNPIGLTQISGPAMFVAGSNATLTTTGQFAIRPLPDANGTAVFEMTITDSAGSPALLVDHDSNPLTPDVRPRITVTISAVNDQPVAFDRSIVTDEAVEPAVHPGKLISAADLLNGTSASETAAIKAKANINPLFNENSQSLEVAQIIVPDSNGNPRVFRNAPGEPTEVLTVNGGRLTLTWAPSAQGAGLSQFVQAVYTPAINYNQTTPFFNITDDFSYVVRDSGLNAANPGAIPPDDNLSDPATVRISVVAKNDLPIFPAFEFPAGSPANTLLFTEIEAGNTTPQLRDVYIASATTQVRPGPLSARDETAPFQIASVRFVEVSAPVGLMTALPTMTNDGVIRVFPAVDAFGDAVYDVIATDGIDDTPAQRITISITGTNDAPVAPDVAPIVTPENTPITIHDVTGILAVDRSASAFESSLAMTTPTSQFNEADQDLQVIGIGIVTGTPAVNAPTPSVLATSTTIPYALDAGLGLFVATQQFKTTHGTLDISFQQRVNGDLATGYISRVDYTPDLNYNNTQGQDVFTYFVSDYGSMAVPNSSPARSLVIPTDVASTMSAPARITMNVTPVNDPPVIPEFENAGVFTYAEDAIPPATVRTQVFLDDSLVINAGQGADEASQTVRITVSTANTPLASELFSAPPTLTADGTLTIFPRANVFGSIDYTVSVVDVNPAGAVLSAPVTRNFTIEITSVNDQPVASAKAFTLAEHREQLDTGGVPVPTSNGSGYLDISANDLLLLNGAGGAAAANSFATSGIGFPYDESAQTSGLRVTGLGLPVTAPATATPVKTANDASLVYGLVAGRITATDTLDTANGTLTITYEQNASNATDKFIASVRYTPRADYNSGTPFPATDLFTYFVDDRGSVNSQSAAATVTMSVTPTNDLPSIPTLANAGHFTFAEDSGPYTVANVFTTSQVILPGPASALDEIQFSRALTTLTQISGTTDMFSTAPLLTNAGRLTFASNPNAFGTAVFNVLVSETDLSGNPTAALDQTRTTQITITLTPDNDVPTAPNRILVMDEFSELTNGTGVPVVDPPTTISVAASRLLDLTGAAEGPALASGNATFAETQTVRVTGIGVPGSTTPLVNADSLTYVLNTGNGRMEATQTLNLANGDLTVTFVEVGSGAAAVRSFDRLQYVPDADYNSSTPGTTPDRFTYFVTDSGTPAATSVPGMVTLLVNPTNDVPTFTINGSVFGPGNTLYSLERDDERATSFVNVVSSVSPGPQTAIDEQANQTVVFRYQPADSAGTNGTSLSTLFRREPDLINGTLFIYPAKDAFGTANLVFRADDGPDSRTNPTTKYQELTLKIRIGEVNDVPILDTSFAPKPLTANVLTVPVTAPATVPDDVFQVDADGTLVYTLREDASNIINPDLIDTTGGGTLILEDGKYLIQVPAGVQDPANARASLLDPYLVGPANEQSVQQFSNINIPTTTTLGGTLERLLVGGELTWLLYTPPANVNRLTNIADSFTYTATDNGQTFNLASSSLVADPKSVTGRVRLIINPVNDAPSFTFDPARLDLNGDANVTVAEGASGGISFNLISNRVAGPAAATDENDASDGQSVSFTVTADAVYPVGTFTAGPTIDALGRLTFSAGTDVSGDFVFNVVAVDSGINDPTGRGDVNRSAAQQFTISILPINDRPQVIPGQDGVTEASVAEDDVRVPAVGITPASGGLEITSASLLQEFQPGPSGPGAEVGQVVAIASGLPMTIGGSMTTPQGGVLTLESAGLYVYSPAVNFVGSDVIVYQVTDGVTPVLTVPGTLSITVTPVNDAPDISSLSLTINVTEDSGLNEIIGWFNGVSVGPNGDATGAGRASDEIDGLGANPPQQFGTITIRPDGILSDYVNLFDFNISDVDSIVRLVGNNLEFDVAPGASGTATFEVTVFDRATTAGADLLSSTTQLTINIGAVNDVPSFDVRSGVTNPTLVDEGSGPNFVFYAENISSGAGESQTTRFVVTVPAGDEALFTSLPTIDASGLLQFEMTENANGTTILSVILTDDADPNDGVSLTSDGLPALATAPVLLTISITAENDPPVATDNSFISTEDSILTFSIQDLIGDDTEIDPGDFLTLVTSSGTNYVPTPTGAQVTTTQGAIVSINTTTGLITYNPLSSSAIQGLRGPTFPNNSVVDTFEYTVVDSANATSTAVVSLNISGANDIPRAVDDIISLDYQLDANGAPIAGSLMDAGNSIFTGRVGGIGMDFDIDVGDDINISSFTVTRNPQFGTIRQIRTPGTNVLTGLEYLPGPNFLTQGQGLDSFEYTLEDMVGTPNGQPSAPATVRIVTRPTPGTEPIRTGTFNNATSNGIATLNLNDVFVSTDGLDLSNTVIKINGTKGVAAIDGNGQLVYTPNPGEIGEDTVTIEVQDVNGVKSGDVEIQFNITNNPRTNPVNPSDVNRDGFVTALDALLIINLLNNGIGADSNGIPLNQIPANDTNLYDVSDDGTVSAVDALRVINALNSQGSANPTGEQVAPQSQSLVSVGGLSATGALPQPTVIASAAKFVGGADFGADDDVWNLIAADQVKSKADSESADSLEASLDAALSEMF